MNYWLLKTEPETFGWENLVKDGKTIWDGVRNYQARNNLRSMKKGDLVLIYHSVSNKEVVGIAKVNKENFQDPTTEDERWLAVEVVPVEAFKRPVTLAEIKANEKLQQMPLIKHTRLSVMPIQFEEFDIICTLGQKK